MTPARRFAFRLALETGYANPDRMLAEMPLRIWREWQLYYDYDPFGNTRGDIQAAIIASTVWNVQQTKKSRLKKPLDYMPKWGPKDEPTPDDQLAKVMLANQMLGGKFIDKRKKKTENGESD